jgi:dTDP-L-rhamnose 4-epimerase
MPEHDLPDHDLPGHDHPDHDRPDRDRPDHDRLENPTPGTETARRILVTGGAGFIGSAIVDQLADAGHEVVVVDLLHPAAHDGKPDYLNDLASYTWGDLRDIDVARSAVAGVDAVCHQASMVGLGVDFGDVQDYVSHNDQGTAGLLRALHDRRFRGPIVLASSMVVYGEGGYTCAAHGSVRPAPRRMASLERGVYEPPCPSCGAALVPHAITEDAPLDPRNVYAATKLHQEHLVHAYAREHEAVAVALRYHNVYGPRMPRDTPYAGVASIFRSAAERGDPPRVFEDGGQRRDFVHVQDVARANVLALTTAVEAPAAELAGAYNVASGEPHTILDMAVALTGAIAGSRPPEVVGGHRTGDVRHVFASPARAERAFGFRASVPFADGMRSFAHDPLRG